MFGKIFDSLVNDKMLDFLWYELGIGRKAMDRRHEREWAQKKENCANGIHIPVRCYVEGPDIYSDKDEYWCQECCKTLTRQAHEDYFSTPEMQAMRKKRKELFGW